MLFRPRDGTETNGGGASPPTPLRGERGVICDAAGGGDWNENAGTPWGNLGGYYSVSGGMSVLSLDKPCVEELVERDEVQLRERRLANHVEMAVLRYQVVGTGSKGAVHELVIVGVGRDDAHAEVRVNELHILLVQYQHDHVLSHGRRNLLLEYLLILVQNLV